MSRSTLNLSDRDIRQRELVPSAKLASCHAVVVGVGAIGRQVAIQLAAVGIGVMDLIDFDHVEVENLAPQAYWQADLGKAKVEATAEACHLLNPALRISQHCERFRRSSPKTLEAFCNPAARSVVFCCVDSITTRQLVWETVRPLAAFFADGRMSAEVIRVLSVAAPAIDIYYPTTLFTAAQAFSGSCTARSTVYTATIAAGLMLAQFTRWLRDLPVERDVLLNLLSMELTAA